MDDVLCRYDRPKRFAFLENALGVAAERIKAEIFQSGFEDEADLGRMTSAEYVAGISKRLGVPVTAEIWMDARKQAMTPDPAMFDLARALMAKVEVAMLTNNGKLLAENIARVMPDIPATFGERAFFSGTLGMGKEHTPTFPAFAKMMGWDVTRMLFVDDSEQYIQAARAAGVVAHHFKGIDGLKAELKRLGL